jgi:hypothetical protein
MVFVIKSSVVNSEFGLYIRLLSVKVYVIVFVKELIRVVYFCSSHRVCAHNARGW